VARVVRLIGAAVGLLVLLILAGALFVPSRQIDVAPAPEADIDNLAVLGRFAGALRFKTISYALDVEPDAEAFAGLHDYLARHFPRVHQQLRRETINDYSLLFTWDGVDPQRKPLVLASHLDVVPIEPGTEDRWTYPPFEGKIADGFIWGRGTLDDKFGVLAILEAVEHLLHQGFQPQSTVYLTFGHDEELGGPKGAAQMARLLADRGVQAELVLDEGGSLIEGALPGIGGMVACVGIAEKGSVSVEVTARTDGGHSSSPPRHTAVGLIGTAVHELERNPMPASIRGALRSFIDHVAPEMSLPYRAVFTNLWLFGPAIRMAFETNPAANASMRTTTAATMIRGGVKENVLPSSASAVVNYRTQPGDTTETVLAHVRRVLNDPRYEVTVVEGSREASAQAPIDVPGFERLARTIRAVYPGTIVAPYLTIGGTDARHYASITRNIYRFTPLIGRSSDLKRVHGTDERTAIEHYQHAIQFFVTLLRDS
jgi:carboxypeptidase PM20D1